MHFTPVAKTISSIFTVKKKYVVPRFQRTFSWDRPQLSEFLTDLITNIRIEDGKIINDSYFFGTILLIGDFEETNTNLEVIDGQQRLTTFTIFFSVLSKILKENGKETLSKELFKLVMGRDINGEQIALLVNETSNEYFARLVQTREEHNQKAITDEEIKIKNAFDYLYKSLQENNLRRVIKKSNNEIVDIEYIKLLLALRDQLLQSLLITITTKEHQYANMIFETLNAKGSKLKSIDLIKNKIFEVIKTEEPIDEAKVLWKTMNENLSVENVKTDIGIFVRHYWNSKYSPSGEKALYNNFYKEIKKDEQLYLDFLRELEKESLVYRNIIKPDYNFYENKQQYFEIHYRLNNISNIMSIIQVRPLLLSLEFKHKEKLLTTKQYIKTLELIENFHFAFNVLASERPSKLSTIYMRHAIALRKSNKTNINKVLNDLKNQLKRLLPKETTFIDGFKKLTFGKMNTSDNMVSKYAIRNIEFIMSESIVLDNEKSIEHIINEDENEEQTINIGNLVILEEVINNSMEVNYYNEKKKYYGKSKYISVSKLIEKYYDFTLSDISKRADELAVLYFDYIKKIFM